MPARLETMPAPSRLIVAMTGAPGSATGVALLRALRATPVETHLVLCPCAEQVIHTETGLDAAAVRALADRAYHPANQAARISSGSFQVAGMVIAPCSLRTMAAIAAGYASNLVQRAADVTLKEARPLTLLLTEPPTGLHAPALDHLSEVPGVRPVPMAPPPDGALSPGTILDALGLTTLWPGSARHASL